MIIFNRKSDWAWSRWEEALIKVVLEHANIKTEEIYAEDMDCEEITLRVTETDLLSGKHTENKYIIRYFEDTAICDCLMFAYFFYLVEGADMTMLDNGAYQIRDVDGHLKYLRLVD